LQEDRIPFEKEILTPAQQVNEYIMTSLRTMEGLDLQSVDDIQRKVLQKGAAKYINSGLLLLREEHLVLTKEGKLLADGIAADLFF